MYILNKTLQRLVLNFEQNATHSQFLFLWKRNKQYFFTVKGCKSQKLNKKIKQHLLLNSIVIFHEISWKISFQSPLFKLLKRLLHWTKLVPELKNRFLSIFGWWLVKIMTTPLIYYGHFCQSHLHLSHFCQDLWIFFQVTLDMSQRYWRITMTFTCTIQTQLMYLL